MRCILACYTSMPTTHTIFRIYGTCEGHVTLFRYQCRFDVVSFKLSSNNFDTAISYIVACPREQLQRSFVVLFFFFFFFWSTTSISYYFEVVLMTVFLDWKLNQQIWTKITTRICLLFCIVDGRFYQVRGNGMFKPMLLHCAFDN